MTPWTAAHQAPPSLGSSRQEHWSGLPCPPPGHLPDLGPEPESSCILCLGRRESLPPTVSCTQIFCHQSPSDAGKLKCHQGAWRASDRRSLPSVVRLNHILCLSWSQFDELFFLFWGQPTPSKEQSRPRPRVFFVSIALLACKSHVALPLDSQTPCCLWLVLELASRATFNPLVTQDPSPEAASCPSPATSGLCILSGISASFQASHLCILSDHPHLLSGHRHQPPL